MVQKMIRVIAVPEGSAPHGIRLAWLGRIVPLISDEKILQGSPPKLDVYSGPNPDKYGYIVAKSVAVRVLQYAGEWKAADFWQEQNDAAGDSMLRFKCADCALID